MNGCPKHDDLILHRLGELDAAARAALDRHLAGCGACREELRRLGAALDAVDSRVNALPAPDLTDRVLARLDARRPRVVRFPWWSAPLAAAAALALLVAGGISLRQGGITPAVAPAIETAAVAPAAPAPAPAPAAEPAEFVLAAEETAVVFDPEEAELWRMLDETTAELAVDDNEYGSDPDLG